MKKVNPNKVILRSFHYAVIHLLVMGILGSTLMVPLALIDYELRKDYISKVLCINRQQPEKGCEGRCFLKKRLGMANETTDSQSAVLQEQFQLSFFNQTVSKLLDDQPYQLVKSDYSVLIVLGTGSSHIRDIFHPPEIV